MKESTGGMLLMGLAAGIIMVFIILVAFFISYGKCFKLKNSLINKLEQTEGVTYTKIKEYFNENGTAYSGKEATICYNKFSNIDDEIIGFNYEITVYMRMDRTILGEVFNPKIPISGETKMIEKGIFLECLKDNTKCISANFNGIEECSNGVSPVGYDS